MAHIVLRTPLRYQSSISSSYPGLLDIFTTDSWRVCKNTIGGAHPLRLRVQNLCRSFFSSLTMQGIFVVPARIHQPDPG